VKISICLWKVFPWHCMNIQYYVSEVRNMPYVYVD
jgi:hypothetical protein